MSPQDFVKLQVLVTGVGADRARAVVRLIVVDGASVVAADKDAAKLTRLGRDLQASGAPVETVRIDLGSEADVQVWAASLRGDGRLPDLTICCCAAGDSVERQSNPHGVVLSPNISLSANMVRDCPAHIVEHMLQPIVFLHAQLLRQSVFNPPLAVIRHPTLRGVVARGLGRRVSDHSGLTPYLRIASHDHSLRRSGGGEPARRGRLHLIPPSPKPPSRADAA